MSGLWRADNRLLGNEAQVIPASTTQVVSSTFRITPGGAFNGMRIQGKFSAFTVGAGITFKLQHYVEGDWTDVTSASITAAGYKSLLINGRDTTASYFSSLPLGNKGRLVVVTTAGAAVTVDEINIVMED